MILISCKFSILCTDDGIKSEKLLLNIIFKPLVFDLPVTYCLSCKKDMENIASRIVKTKNNKRVMSSKCSICNNKKSKFISQGSGLFDSLGLNTLQNRNAFKTTSICL